MDETNGQVFYTLFSSLYNVISQSGSTFLQAFNTFFITAFSSAPSANSTFIFCVIKLTTASLTPSVFFAACCIFSAQLAQSTSILYVLLILVLRSYHDRITSFRPYYFRTVDLPAENASEAAFSKT